MVMFTNIQTLSLVIEIWTWCKSNPMSPKYTWPRWEKNGGDIPDMQHNCPCCEYTRRFGGNAENQCSHCLLWGEDRPFPGHCLDKGSVFQKWADARSPKSRVKYSKMMIETAENQLEKILREE